MNKAVDLIIENIGELVTADSNGGQPLHGADMQKVLRIKDATVACANGVIVACGKANEVFGEVSRGQDTEIVDACGKLVTPGFIDPHTHLIFAGNRAGEFIMRTQGKTYQEIAAAGGGIVASTAATRKATVDELKELGRMRLSKMLACGTTSCEVKTGYGLDFQSEIAMLTAIVDLAKSQPVELVPTFMPAHAFAKGVDRQAYIAEIVNDMLPYAQKMVFDAKLSNPPLLFNDVFCDQGYFTLAETRQILEAGIALGLKPKVHADEFANLGATTLAVELKAVSCDHLLNVSDKEIALLSKSNTVATILPGTSFFLNLAAHAPARKMIDSGVAVALGSDFNPGSCHIYSLPFIFGLACLNLKMTPEEALVALTVNAAHAIGHGGKVGSIHKGQQADLLLMDIESLEEIAYNMVANPVAKVIKRGKRVVG